MKPLNGVKIIDLTHMLAGPYAGMVLADLGAEVVKVEPLLTGEMTRGLLKDDPNYSFKDFGAYFLTLNRNKKSVSIDLKNDQGLEVFYDLIQTADIVLNNFSAGVVKKLKIDFDHLSEVNPKIITCSITGFGETGPHANRPAYDQIVHDVALQNLPVRFAIDRAGLVGADGATHAGVFDISYMSNIPNMTVMAAADEAELVHMVRTAVEFDEGPIAFRYPRGNGTGIQLPKRGEILQIGKGRIIQEGTDLVIVSFGAHMNLVKDAEVALAKMGVSVTIADARFAKPLDVELINQLMENHPCMLTVEQGSMGGFGSIVLQHVNKNKSINENLIFDSIFVADKFIDQADVNSMYEDAGLGIDSIIDKSITLIERSSQISKKFDFGDFKENAVF